MTSPNPRSPSASLRSARLLRLDYPVRSLTLLFCLWKALIFICVTASPGPGYDTSTTLLPEVNTGVSELSATVKHPAPLSIPLRFVRWDSIYFVHIAQNGYVFEQEWAFGYGYTKVLRFLAASA